jgi:chromosome segregation ATPase
MDELLHEAPAADDWRANLAQRVQVQRRRAQEQFEARRTKLKELEGRMEALLTAVAESAAAEHDQLTNQRSELDIQLATVNERQQSLDTRQQDLERRVASGSGDEQAKARQQQLLDEVARRLAELEKRQGELAEQERGLQDRQVALARRETELQSQAAELDRRQATLTGSTADLDRRRNELELARTAQRKEADALQVERNELRKQQADLAVHKQQLAEREHETQRQRRHIAQQLRAKKHELTSEIELHRAEALASASGQEVQQQMRLAELQGKYDRLKEEFDQRRDERDDATQKLAELKGQQEVRQAELAQQRAALDESQRKLGELEAVRRDLTHQLEEARAKQGAASSDEAKALQRQLDEVRKARAAEEAEWSSQRQKLESDLAAAAKKGGKGGADPAELAKLREENKQLETWLAEAEEKAKRAGSGEGGDNEELDDLRRRFEMAVQDVRELKTKNAELTDQLAKAKQNAGKAAAGGGGGGSDWESMKKNLLAQLDADFDTADEKQSTDKMTVEGAIKITDKVVADKEAEIQELKKLLESQAQSVGDMAVGAAGVIHALDTDELVRQERENLKKLQDSVRDQFKKLEVDLSLERAKVARERAELEEKVRAFESERAAAGVVETPNGDKGKKAKGGKWLARLGLQGGKEE